MSYIGFIAILVFCIVFLAYSYIGVLYRFLSISPKIAQNHFYRAKSGISEIITELMEMTFYQTGETRQILPKNVLHFEMNHIRYSLLYRFKVFSPEIDKETLILVQNETSQKSNHELSGKDFFLQTSVKWILSSWKQFWTSKWALSGS